MKVFTDTRYDQLPVLILASAWIDLLLFFLHLSLPQPVITIIYCRDIPLCCHTTFLIAPSTTVYSSLSRDCLPTMEDVITIIHTKA